MKMPLKQGHHGSGADPAFKKGGGVVGLGACPKMFLAYLGQFMGFLK